MPGVFDDVFKRYDVRGLFPQQLNEEIACTIGRAFASHLHCKAVAVGRDHRIGSQQLFNGFCAGLVQQGCDVTDLGLISTDMIYFTVGNYGFDAGCMITASVDGDEYTLIEDLGTRERKLVKVGEFIDKTISSKNFETFAVLSFNPKTGGVLFQKIRNVFKHPIREPLFELKLSGGRTVRVTASHSVFVYKNNEITSMPTKCLGIGDLVAVPNYFPNFSFVPEIDLVKELLPFGRELRGIVVKGPDVIKISRSRVFAKRVKRLLLTKCSRSQILKKRKEMGLSRMALAKLAGISPQTIQRIELETNRHFVKEKYLKKYLSALGLNEKRGLKKFVFEEKIFDQMLKDGRTFNGLKLMQLNRRDINSIKECTLHGAGCPRNAVSSRFLITSDFARVLGYYIAEGNLECDDRICFNLGQVRRGHEGYIFNDINSFFKKNFAISPKVYKRRNATKVTINNVVLFGLFANVFGFKKKSSSTKFVPNFVFTLPLGHRLEFLKGLFLGDGSLSNGKWIKFNSTSRELTTGVSYLLTQLGVKYCVAKRTDKRKNRQPMYEILIVEKESLEKIRPVWSRHWNAKTITTSYKMKEKKHLQFNNLLLLPIREIKKVKPSSSFVYDFSVEGETFIAGLGGVCCHNSHNPKEFNGLKFVGKGSVGISSETGLLEIKALAEKCRFAESHKKGKVVKRDILNDYTKKVLSFVDAKKMLPLRIVVDASNGMASKMINAIEKKLPLHISKLFFELDSAFPNHQPNPLDPVALATLQKKVVAEKADAGALFDGDGDRMFMVDEKGAVVNGSELTCLIASDFLRRWPGSKILYTPVMSKVVLETIKASGGIPVLERVGHTFIKTRMRKEKAVFGGELSGHFYFRDNFFADSGLIALLVALEALSESGKKLSELIAPFRRYYAIDETNSDVSDKDAKMAEIERIYAPKAKSTSKLDGFSAYFDDWWFNVRASGTENLLRLNLEANSRELMQQKKEELLKIIRS